MKQQFVGNGHHWVDPNDAKLVVDHYPKVQSRFLSHFLSNVYTR